MKGDKMGGKTLWLRSFPAGAGIWDQASWPNAFRMTNHSGWRTKMKKRWRDELAPTKTRKRLLPRRVQFEGEDFGVSLEIGVGGKNGPVASDGDGANQDVGDGYGHSPGPAHVARFCR